MTAAFADDHTTPTIPGPRTYGGYRPLSTPGLFGLGIVGTLILFFLFLLVLGVQATAGLGPAAAVAAGGALVLASVLIKDRDRRNVISRIGEALGWRRSRRSGANLYRSGPLSHHPWGTHALPGLAGTTELYEFFDSYGHPFALLKWTTTNDFTIVFTGTPEGQVLVDEEQVDVWVADYGAWLAALADEPGLLGASVIVESAPDTGARLRAKIAAKADPRGHPVSLAVLRESAETFPVGTPQVTAWITLTYTAPDGRGDVPAAGAKLADRIAGLAASLSNTGIGAVAAATPEQLCEEVRIIFDPEAAVIIDAAEAAGKPVELDWHDIGPAFAEAHKDHYLHEGAASITWEMTTPPRGLHHANVLSGLIAPQMGLRKRVALHYQVVPPWKAATMVDRDVRTAEFAVSQSKKPSARAITEMRAARQTADEEARGASLLNLAMLVTVTASDTPHASAVEQLPAVAASIDSVAPAARVRLRRPRGSQDSAFLGTCPVGAIYPRHMRTPAHLREAM